MPHKLWKQTRKQEAESVNFRALTRKIGPEGDSKVILLMLGEDGELCYTLTGMEEVFRCKIDRRLKKEEVRSDRSAE